MMQHKCECHVYKDEMNFDHSFEKKFNFRYYTIWGIGTSQIYINHVSKGTGLLCTEESIL